ncbi:hypothetical protein CPC16_009205 [Podila verticillata]|nr:hypothetical protein CPC16_009205 [Podila verticillata]
MTITTVPRDRTKDPISAPMVTCYNVKSLIDSPQFCQRAILPSGRTVSYTTCGSRTGSLVLYFYGLGGSCRQLAIMHAQAVRLDIKLLCIDRPGTGFTESFIPKSKSKLNLFSRSSKAWSKSSSTPSTSSSPSSPSSSTASSGSFSNGSSPTSSTASEFSTNLRARSTSSLPITKRRGSGNGGNGLDIFGSGKKKMSCLDLSRPERDAIAEESEPDGDEEEEEEEEEEGDNRKRKGRGVEGVHSSKDSRQGSVPLNHNVAHGPGADKRQRKRKQKKPTLAAQRIDYVCQEALELVDTLFSRDTKFGMIGHSCGIYYIMRMLQQHSDRILDGPIALLTPWVPFNECPETTSKSFKFLRHIPRGVVWAVTSSMNHIGSVILSSSSALSTTFAKQDDIECGKNDREGEKDKPSTDPFVLQFSDAVDKVVLPALVQDMNRQNSSGYNCEIQMCISDIGYDLAAIPIPSRVRVHAYCGYLDDMVPLGASREMGTMCGWKMHEFKFSGHGGPRIFMTALEDYAIARAMLKHGLN